MFSGLIAFGVVVGLRWLAIAATGWSLGGLLLRIRMLGARNQTPLAAGLLPARGPHPGRQHHHSRPGHRRSHAHAAADPEGRGWHDKLSGMALLHTRKTKRPDRATISAAEPGAGPRASPAPGPRQGPALRKDPSPRTPVRLGTLPSAPPSPPRTASRAPRARSPPRHHPRRPLRRRTSPPPAVGAPRGPSGRPRRRRRKPQNAVLERAPHAHGPAIRFRRRVPRPPPWEPRAPQKRES